MGEALLETYASIYSIPSVPISSHVAAETLSRHILYDIPVSNNGARCRIILYKKGIDDSECIVKSPMDLGGLKSEAYLQISPEGKVPALQICESNGGCIGSQQQLSTLAESDTVARYLLKTYATVGPSFQPDLPLSNEISRFHDMYLTTIQGCLYKASPPFGPYGNRKEALEEYSNQLYVIADNFVNKDEDSVYLCGADVSLADATLFPSMVFATHMFPKFDLAINSDPSRPVIPPILEAWFRRLIETDTAFRKVYGEVRAAYLGLSPKFANYWILRLSFLVSSHILFPRTIQCLPYC
jgi:glutathione S-transferase